jgi:hypothetical protein
MGWLWLAAASNFLTQAGLRYGPTGRQTAVGEVCTMKLARGRVIRLPDKGSANSLRVLQGTAWLTGTPDRRDVILETGDQFVLSGRGPFVIEALSDLGVILEP